MSLPAVFSGDTVMITGVTGMQSLTVTSNQPTSEFSHAGVPGGVQVGVGMAEFGWSANGVGADPGLFPLRTGSGSKQLTFYYSTPDKFSYSGTIYVASLSINMNKEAKQNPITWNASGMFSGALASVTTGVEDVGGYAAETGSYLDVKIDGSSITECVKSVTLNFSQNLGGYNCTYHEVVGGNLRGSVTIALNNHNIAAISGEKEVSIVVDGSGNAWDINHVIFTGSSITGSRVDPNPVTNTITGVIDLSSTPGIRGPGGNTYYGEIS